MLMTRPGEPLDGAASRDWGQTPNIVLHPGGIPHRQLTASTTPLQIRVSVLRACRPYFLPRPRVWVQTSVCSQLAQYTHSGVHTLGPASR